MLGLDFGMTLVLIICILVAMTFEFINGFHDTANAVATVIYTNSMKPTAAVIWSGLWNFAGVFFGGIAVAMGIINLLPLSILSDQSTAHSIAMILSLLLTAIMWNIGTWYLGIPCSSSHTLLGSIFGVGIAYGLLPGVDTVALNWSKVKDVGLALLVSPIQGFGLTMLLVMIANRFIKYKKLFREPKKNKKPPFWIRLTLIGTCTGVSFTHGSNDGQKGAGLMMLILIAIVPVHFALNHDKHISNLRNQVNIVDTVINRANPQLLTASDKITMAVVHEKIDTIRTLLAGVENLKDLKKESHLEIRNDILLISKEAPNLLSVGPGRTAQLYSKGDRQLLKTSLNDITGYIEYVPVWVIALISISLERNNGWMETHCDHYW
jgi:PiT family inorganic phosphate transporter